MNFFRRRKSQKLELGPDPHEPFRLAYDHGTWWRRMFIGLMAFMMVRESWREYRAILPPPTIVWDRVQGGLPKIVRPGLPPSVTVTDARNFFIGMLQLRHGWSSLTVQRDLDALKNASLPPYQEAFDQFLRAELTTQQGGTRTQMQEFIQSEVNNEILFPDNIEKVDCTSEKVTNGTNTVNGWTCRVIASIVTQRLRPPYLPTPIKRRWLFGAALWEVPTTLATPAGLALANMTATNLDDDV